MPRTRGGAFDPYEGLDGGSGGRRASRGSRGRGQAELEEESLDEAALEYGRDDFEINEMVLAQNPEHNETWWPGILLDPKLEVPEYVKRIKQRDKRFCVMFYGPGSQLRTRDFLWVTGDGDLLPLAEYQKRLRDTRHDRGEEWAEAIEELALIKRGQRSRIHGALDEEFGQGGRGHVRQQRTTECTSCGCSLDNFEVANARQLNSRCEGCHDRYSRGHFCPVCDKVWHAEEKDMVGCDSCSFWVHAACDRLASKALTSSELDYYCPHCRKVRNFHARLAALQQAENAVRNAEPRAPRSAYHLFAQEIHRQYNVDSNSHSLGRVVTDTWRSLTAEERTPYERVASGDMARFQREQRSYQEVQRKYTELRIAAEQDGVIDDDGQPIKIPKLGGHRPHSAVSPVSRPSANVGRPGNLRLSLQSSGGSRSLQRQSSTPRASISRPKSSGPAKAIPSLKRPKRESSPDYVPQPSKKKRERGYTPPRASLPPETQNPAPPVQTSQQSVGNPDVPDEVPIFCNNTSGILLLQRQRVLCSCKECACKAGGMQEFSCTQFEQHCGAGSAKKWKASLRIPPGGVPEVPSGTPSMPVGKWMEIVCMDAKAPGGRREGVIPPPVTRPTNQRLANQNRHKDHVEEDNLSNEDISSESPPPEREREKDRERKAVKKEDKDAAMWEPWLEINKGNFKPVKVRWAGDRCTVCDSDVDFDSDQLVSCDNCGITVHQTCYGVPELPGEDDLWLCRSCEFKEEGKDSPQCCLCPVSGGALKRTTEPGLWCHAACMQWIPEVTVEDLNRMEPVSHIRSIQKERWDLNCCVCRQRVGAKIQCSSCYTAYHPLCGRIAGLHMEMVDPEGPNEAVRLVSYCTKHCQPKPHMSGVKLISKEEESKQKMKGDEGNGLWNAQLFPPPALVPVPDCPSGCARMEPLESQGWVRKSHGTGTGHSSSAGYWIPKKAAEVKVAPRVTPASRKRKSSGAGFARGRPSGAPKGRPTKSSTEEVAEETADSDQGLDAAHGEDPYTALDALPEGVPEEVPIQCNGKSALLLIRPQRVLYNDQEISASKFEALCGKGDAKKWKCSIWYEDEDGEPKMMMQDWLNQRKLDRKALANLANNQMQAEAYAAYANYEVKLCVEGIIQAVCDSEQPTAQEAAQTMKQAPTIEQEENPSGEAVPKDAQAPQGDGEAPADSLQREPDVMPEEQAEPMDVDLPSSKAVPDIKAAKREPADGIKVVVVPVLASEGKAAIPNGTATHEAADKLESPEKASQAGVNHAPAPKEVPDATTLENGLPESGPEPVKAAALEPEQDNKDQANHSQQEEAEQKEKKDPQKSPAATPSLRPSVAPVDGGPTHAAPVEPPEATGTGPASVLGHQCEVKFEEDAEWYRAIVRAYDKASKLHNLWYYYDGEAEWIDLLEEDKSGRVRWDNPKLAASLRVTATGKRGMPPAIVRDALNGERAPVGSTAIGWRIGVWWRDDSCFYKGTIELYSSESGRHKVKYDDGETEYLLLSAEHVRWDQRPLGQLPPTAEAPVAPSPADPTVESQQLPQPQQQGPQDPPQADKKAAEERPGHSQAENPVEDKAAQAARLERAAQAPDRVSVVCNAARGTFLTQRGAVLMSNGQTVSPTEFERFAGKAASKKWKASIRVDKGNGSPGITIGDWLVDQGLDAPKAPRIRSGGVGGFSQPRPSVAARTAAAVPAARMPSIMGQAKQSRRTGKPWSGMLGGPSMPVYIPAPPSHAGVPARQAIAATARHGKRAYPWQVPKSRLYTSEEWETALTEANSANKSNVGLQSQCSGVLDSGLKAEVDVKDEPLEAEKPAKEQRKALTLKERLEICQATERQRLSFCKSGIHGWGLVARVEMKQDSMVIEYRGEALRRCMADFRERIYRGKEMDCYLFNINDDVVVDATMKGTIGRFTNHCCSPSLYTKVLEVDGQPHLVFFARQDIRIGQELTYDYRFKEEEGDNKLHCQCGAPNCRGFMN